MTNLSYVCGVGTEPLLYKTVGAVLEDAAARWGEREALIVRHQNIRWTYRELDEAADRLAAGLLQLGLALMATWGLVAYAVERRTAEIAIRRALGATEAGILRLVMRPSLWLLAVGAPIGAIAGAAIATVMHSEFLGQAPLELAVVVPAIAVLVPVVIVAAWLPARRALAIEPAAALKDC